MPSRLVTRSEPGAPGADPPHDEKLLARLDEPKPARLPQQLLPRPDCRDPSLQLILLRLKPADLGVPVRELSLHVLVSVDRLPVKNANKNKRPERKQASRPKHSQQDFAPRRTGPSRERRSLSRRNARGFSAGEAQAKDEAVRPQVVTRANKPPTALRRQLAAVPAQPAPPQQHADGWPQAAEPERAPPIKARRRGPTGETWFPPCQWFPPVLSGVDFDHVRRARAVDRRAGHEHDEVAVVDDAGVSGRSRSSGPTDLRRRWSRA